MDSENYVHTLHEQTDILHSLLEVGAHLSTLPDRRKVLDMILREARRLARAEAGSLYVCKDARLQFVAAQNDRLADADVTRLLLDREMDVSDDSLAGYVARTGRVMNIPDADHLPEGTPFRINHDFDSQTGFRASTILAIPLRCTEDDCVGVLELFNRLDPRGRPQEFPSAESLGIPSLSAMAALAIQNMLLQEQLKQAHLDTIVRLSVAVEFRDTCTGDHVRRIASTVGLIARALGLDPTQIELVECASPMHDIGKIGIPDAILNKPARLTPEERKIVEQHPLIGAEILGQPQNDFMTAAHEVALSHHERWDGHGYPNRLSGDFIPLSARIVGLADVFDALLTERPYKKAYPLDVALETVHAERGKHFDPAVTDALLGTIDSVLPIYAGAQATCAAAQVN